MFACTVGAVGDGGLRGAGAGSGIVVPHTAQVRVPSGIASPHTLQLGTALPSQKSMSWATMMSSARDDAASERLSISCEMVPCLMNSSCIDR